jgi:hypothetical protein
VTPRLQDVADGFGLLQGHLVELQQLPEADDRVERGAQLVAHPRQELVLRRVRALGLRTGGFCGPLGEPLVGDVLRDPEQVARLAALVVDRDLAGVDDARAFRGLDRFVGNVDHRVAGEHLAILPDEDVGGLLGRSSSPRVPISSSRAVPSKSSPARFTRT